MKAYTIATRATECYGHGDYGEAEKICRVGDYDTGEFPPIFTDRSKALDYMMSQND